MCRTVELFFYKLIFLCTLCFHGRYAQYTYDKERLHQIHHSLKKRDLFRIFGVEHVHQVPHYEISIPRIHTEIKDFNRVRRDISSSISKEPMNLNFAVSAYKKDFHFNLTLNKRLFAPNFKVEVKGHNGTVKKKDVTHCHYTGNVHQHQGSVAAISTCNGLSGLFTAEGHDYFMEPVPDYLHSVQTVESDINRPHILFRRSLDHENVKKENPGDTFNRLWHKGSNVKRTCGTSDDPTVKLRRSADDVSSLVNVDDSEKYIEALVVVDQKMVNYHGEDAATQFALVVLNIVSSLLHDGTIGTNLIILAIVRLELHTVDVPGLIINHHARNTLESFGNWAARASDQDDRSDDHYDYAILLTRYNICADDRQPCDMLGLAHTGGMCTWPTSASINEDNGLPLAYTVTHSIGHSLGMNHDGDESSFICPDNTYIMSSTVSQDWKESRNQWSRCSRNYLRQFLKKPQARCLDDIPMKEKSVDYTRMDSKPGVLYDASKQCEMQFGTGSKVCNKNKGEEVCWKLSCSNPTNADKCFTSIYPAADGTACGNNKYCFHGKCVVPSDISTVDGGWSIWSEDYSPCSRSCGGGVQFRKRHCNHPKPSNEGKYCEGESHLHRLCNTKACPSNLVRHRNLQCSLLNNRLFGERKFEWEFKPSKIDSCKLGCFISGTGHGYDFGSVEDGTNCDQTDDCVLCDKCINGMCVSVGCDGTLGSHTKFDRCGVCNGDGSSCVTGSERSEIPDSSGGIVDALKSLKEMGFNMGSLYGKSSLDLDSKRSGVPGGKTNNFGWAHIKSGCSVSCGGGTETITAECRRQDDGSPVSEEKCDRSLKPPVQQYPCKTEVCPPVWQTSYWGDCSKTCNGGFKKRNVRCVQRSGVSIEYDIDGSLCIGPKPSDTEGCNKEPCPAEWVAQPFGECSTICGPGVQVRDVLCQRSLKDGTISTETESECRKETKPPIEQKCNAHNPCPGDAGCGGIYTEPHGNFTSPSYPSAYPNNMECVHIIQVQEGKLIKLDFDKMNIVSPDEKSCRSDFVKVMDGDCVSHMGESKFCGKSVPPSFVSTTNRLCVKFFSDDSQNGEGFVARYHDIEKPLQTQELCGANLTSPAGLISSPNYPEYYPVNEDCNITISTDEKPIKISFQAFDVGSDDCSTDYLYLTGGKETKKYCGQKLPPAYISQQSPVSVRFVSSSHPATLKSGFVATYTSGSGAVPSVTTRQEISNVDKNATARKADDASPSQNTTTTSSDSEDKSDMMELLKDATNSSSSNKESKKSAIPEKPAKSPPSTTKGVSFIKVKSTTDEVAKAVAEKTFKRFVRRNITRSRSTEPSLRGTPEEKKAYINAMKDDTPSWIPVAEDFAARKSSIGNITVDDRANTSVQSHAPAKSNITNRATISRPTKVLNRSSKYIVERPAVVFRPNGPPGQYQLNLDGQKGNCPLPANLHCLRVLMSYPCNSDHECRSGFACCRTSCSYGNRMCTPKVTQHCPLRDPFYSPFIPCHTETDCPRNSPCCLDMSNRRYCRQPLPDK